MNFYLVALLFASFFCWAFGANIVRITGGAENRGMFVVGIGLLSAITVHVLPFFKLSFFWALGLIAGSYLVSAIISGTIIGLYNRSEDWPEDFYVASKYGAPNMLVGSLILAAMAFVEVS